MVAIINSCWRAAFFQTSPPTDLSSISGQIFPRDGLRISYSLKFSFWKRHVLKCQMGWKHGNKFFNKAYILHSNHHYRYAISYDTFKIHLSFRSTNEYYFTDLLCIIINHITCTYTTSIWDIYANISIHTLQAFSKCQ